MLKVHEVRGITTNQKYPEYYVASNGHLMVEVPPGWTPPEQASLRRRRKGGEVSKSKRARILARDGFQCVSCSATEDLCMDHIKPIIKGGSNEEANLQTLCRPCNSTKGTRYE